MKFQTSGIREIDFMLTKSSIRDLRRNWKGYLKTISAYPKERHNGRGIIMCAGGIDYMTCAWIAIKRLRTLNCKLPIEIWHLGNEISQEFARKLEKLNVTCINAFGYTDNYMEGYAIKPFAILNSKLKEVLLLDADNICISNPEFLFDFAEYKETGAIFWPDFWETASDNPIWNIMGVSHTSMKEQESGQILINKEKCWEALNLCQYLNEKKAVYHKLLLGDKDTFRFSWMAITKPFYMVEKEPSTCGYIDNNNDFMGHTMLQFSPDLAPLFLHRNLLKWSVTRNNEFVWKTVKQFKGASKCKQYVIDISIQNAHSFIDINGDVNISDFEESFGNIEMECMDNLIALRKTDWYRDFFIYSHLQSKRFRIKTNIFQDQLH